MAQPNPAIPIHLAPAHRDVIPSRYILHVHTQICRCGALHEHSEFYAKTHLRSTMGQKYITNLRPIHHPEEIAYNLPIDVVKLEPKRIMFCSECISGATLSHLPLPPALDTRRPGEELRASGLASKPTWMDKKPKPATTKPQSKFTVDDL